MDYGGNTPMPGPTWQQDYAIDLALGMVGPVGHDGLKRQIFAILGTDGFSDEQMRQAIARVLSAEALIYIPSCLFPSAG